MSHEYVDRCKRVFHSVTTQNAQQISSNSLLILRFNF